MARFRRAVWRHFREHGRDLPWRRTQEPYHILVSEVMLQQTQVERVIPKYHLFLECFPDFASLARAPFREVLAAWHGLGYNRRALTLQDLARRVIRDFQGRLPRSPQDLRTLPGIGPATAGALAAFAFGEPAVFIETNIRRVFLYFFCPGQEGVPDRDLLPLVAQTLDRRRVRPWYYALMDYGAMLKTRTGSNPNRRSAHYARQSPFTGSDRQLRGQILKKLLEHPVLSLPELVRLVGESRARLQPLIDQLIQEGFLERQGRQLHIAATENP